jgi:hypothetical protein
MPRAAGSCWVDGDCTPAQHCARDAFTCLADKGAGETIPDDTLHTGVCNDANSLAACASGACNPTTNTCARPNGEACTTARECIGNACGSNGKCGLADGDKGCDLAGATACQSGICSAGGVCLAIGRCWVDADCGSTLYCNRSTSTCAPKELAGAPIPKDGLHDGRCTEPAAKAVCETGLCNPETNTCAAPQAAGCTSSAQCVSGVCAPDGSCGTPGGATCTSNLQCRSGTCLDGACTIPGAKVTGRGLVECAVHASRSEGALSAWPVALFGAAAFLRRRSSRERASR